MLKSGKVAAASVAPAPKPKREPVHPWRWRLGQSVYALGHAERLTFVGGRLIKGFPYLDLCDHWGEIWQVPQLHTSSKPFAPARD